MTKNKCKRCYDIFFEAQRIEYIEFILLFPIGRIHFACLNGVPLRSQVST